MAAGHAERGVAISIASWRELRLLVEEAGDMWSGGRAPDRNDLRPLRTLAVALVFGCALALAVALRFGSGGHVALACGSGQPVMQANGLLATLDPSTFNSGTDLPDTGGIFNLDYGVGQQIAFAEDLSYIGATPPADLKLRWKFGDSNSYSYTATPSHTYAKAGTYLVWVDYYDSTSDQADKWTFFDYAHIHVVASLPPTPPIAHFTASGTTVVLESDQNAALTFDASGSKSLDGSPLTYTWDFNDGTSSTGEKVTHRYVLPGKTLVELIVTDAHGAKAVETMNIGVVSTQDDLPRAAVAASSSDVAPNQLVTFDASQTQLPKNEPNDQIVKFVWNFGDGTPAQATTGPTTSHSYKQAGTYTVTIQAFDLQGAAGAANIVITVATPGPNWLLFGFGSVALAATAVGAYFLIQSQRRYTALVRERERAMQLARARRVTERRPGPATRPPPRAPRARG